MLKVCEQLLRACLRLRHALHLLFACLRHALWGLLTCFREYHRIPFQSIISHDSTGRIVVGCHEQPTTILLGAGPPDPQCSELRFSHLRAAASRLPIRSVALLLPNAGFYSGLLSSFPV